jgi:hypothetical protein
MLIDMGNNLFSFTLMFSPVCFSFILKYRTRLRCVGNPTLKQKKREENVRFDRQVSVSVDHDQMCTTYFSFTFSLSLRRARKTGRSICL